jgi:DDE_Tnp_1-associated
MDATPKLGLLHFLGEIPDPRSPKGRQHPLVAILALSCCAIMCGARSYSAIGQWGHDHDISLMHRLGFTRRPPKSGGIRKVLMALDPATLEAALTRWAEALLGPMPAAEIGPPEAFALDGKSARGSFDGLSKAVHLLSLVAHKSGLTVAQAEVPRGGADKTNEHKAALGLLSGLVLEGRLITGDAMFCQRDLSRQVLDGGGHYLWVVKDNQPTLLADIQAALDPGAAGAFSPSAAATLA